MEIESNIPIPAGKGATGKTGRPAKYPWAKMQIGDSFWVSPDQMPASGQAGISVRAVGALGAGNFRTRKENGGVRVWRLA